MKYLYWRGKTLWSRYPISGYPKAYSLGIKTTGSKTDRARCEKLGETTLAALRVKDKEGKLFDKKKEQYSPKYWRLVARYSYYHLKFKRSYKNERYSLLHSLKIFGSKRALDITRSDIEIWRNKMKANGDSINSINNRFAYLRAVFNYANTESREELCLNYDPTKGLKKLPGAKIRQFLLTKERFERNYHYLKNESFHFSQFYLALWETGRRPQEVARYTWDMFDIDEKVIYVPEELNKKERSQILPVSDRLFKILMSTSKDERNGFLFKNKNGNAWLHYKRHMKKLKEKFGVSAGWARDNRRGFITHKCEVLGCDPTHVQAFSGHSTMECFQRYRIGQLSNLKKVANA